MAVTVSTCNMFVHNWNADVNGSTRARCDVNGPTRARCDVNGSTHARCHVVYANFRFQPYLSLI